MSEEDSSHLPGEMILEILSRLPPKSLLRFMSVSKSWRSLISSPDFFRNHTQLYPSKQTPRKLLVRSSVFSDLCSVHVDDKSTFPLLEEIPLPVNFTRLEIFTSQLEILGNCNGILCIVDPVPDRSRFVLWNPSIRKHVNLPRPLNSADHSKYRALMGFGFDLLTNDFKLVKITYRLIRPWVASEHHVAEVYPAAEVYTLMTNKWRRIPFPSEYAVSSPDIFHVTVPAFPCFVSGSFHWLHQSGVDGFMLLTFDISKEIFGEIRLPRNDESYYEFLTTPFVIGESLGVVFYDGNDAVGWIWAMRDYGDHSSWTMVHKVNSEESPGKHVNSLLSVRSNGGLVIEFVVSEFVTYDFVTGVSENIRLADGFGSFRDPFIDTYVESLALLNEGISTVRCEENKANVSPKLMQEKEESDAPS